MPKLVECDSCEGKGCHLCLWTGKVIDWSDDEEEE